MNDLYDSIEEKKKKRKKAGSESSKESSLRDWFGRKGAKGKKKGWVDCNSPDGKGGYKSCGRGSGEKRKKYPACRPTPGACKERGKGKSWGKKAKKKSKKKNEELYMDLEQIIQEEIEAVMSENMSADELENQFVQMYQTNKGKMNGPMKVILQKLTKLSKQGRYHKNVQAALRKKIRTMEEEIALDEKKKKKKKKKKSSGKKDACYHKVKSRYKVWPSAYASGALVKCRKVGAKNWGNSKKESLELDVQNEIELILQESHSKEHEEELKKIADELRGASKMHASQAERVEKILDETDDDELKETSFEEGGCGMDDEEPTLKVAVKEELNCGCGKDPCETYGKNSEKLAIMVREELEAVVREKKKKKACKPSKGKRFAKRVDGKCRSFGQKGKAKGGGDRIRPGTKKGDAYCARSAKIKKCKNPPCANALSRKKWKCRGSKSMKE